MSLVATLKNWVLRGRADEAQVPEVQVLPDGRKRLTRRVKLGNKLWLRLRLTLS